MSKTYDFEFAGYIRGGTTIKADSLEEAKEIFDTRLMWAISRADMDINSITVDDNEVGEIDF